VIGIFVTMVKRTKTKFEVNWLLPPHPRHLTFFSILLAVFKLFQLFY